LILYILINLGLSLYVVIYRATVTKANTLVIFARIGGMLLNFNCTLVIVLMLKYTMLMARSNKYLRKWIPVDDHIDFHKFVGRFITGLVIIHTIAHMTNFGLRTGKLQIKIVLEKGTLMAHNEFYYPTKSKRAFEKFLFGYFISE
jgi:predicted ferric reductase